VTGNNDSLDLLKSLHKRSRNSIVINESLNSNTIPENRIKKTDAGCKLYKATAFAKVTRLQTQHLH
jgi:hypothetical protein